jgi:hypothetical protein
MTKPSDVRAAPRPEREESYKVSDFDETLKQLIPQATFEDLWVMQVAADLAARRKQAEHKGEGR